MKKMYWMISLFIVIIIGAHILPILQELGGERQTLWPIMAWGMYRKSYPANQEITGERVQVSAKTENGSILQVTSLDQPLLFNLFRKYDREDKNVVRLAHYAYRRFFVKPMLQGDQHAATKLAAILNQGRLDRITQIQVQRHRYGMRDTGIEKLGSPLMIYDVSP